MPGRCADRINGPGQRIGDGPAQRGVLKVGKGSKLRAERDGRQARDVASSPRGQLVADVDDGAGEGEAKVPCRERQDVAGAIDYIVRSRGAQDELWPDAGGVAERQADAGAGGSVQRRTRT